ncbi:lipoprotein [Actinoplanes sp. CA-030573]|uniref:lipoprotein n=1 Tax=Actinoplanes sp. CA-030573 TaxID=3239898 RepID=UPI003D94AF2C
MRRSIAAIVLLLALSACSDGGGAASAAPQWKAPAPRPTATVLPAGLVLLTTKGESASFGCTT